MSETSPDFLAQVLVLSNPLVAGVTEEYRKALLGHKNGSFTRHCSGAELGI